MNIQNIQNAAGFFRAAQGKTNSGGGNVPASGDLSRTATDLPAAQESNILPGSSGLSGNQTNALQVVYPPFFPIGNTQGIYTDLSEVSSERDAADFAKTLPEADDPAAAQVADREPASNDTAVPEGGTVEPGSVLNLTA